MVVHVENFAKLDTEREARKAVPEIIFGEGKREDDVLRIAKGMYESMGRAIVSRINRDVASKLEKVGTTSYNERARMAVLKKNGFSIERRGKVGILAGGTSDLPVAEEARIIAEEMGCEVVAEYDVGVAGIHRLFPALEKMKDADVLIVVAGMEGALASVVAGLAKQVVIGVPTSVGYGYGGKGEAALMSMLQSCAPGLLAVNIDNGIGAGISAALIARH